MARKETGRVCRTRCALPLQLTMAASGLDEVVSLSIKAQELYDKSHYERSIDKWRAALAGAVALGAEDCVLVAQFKSDLANALFDCEYGRAGARLSQGVVLELLDLLAASAAALRRRRDAGTLMEGKCRPAEEHWSYKSMENGWSQDAAATAQGEPMMRASAKLVGYEAFLNVCSSSLTLLGLAITNGSFEHGVEAEHFLSFVCDLCDDAIALMVQPRLQMVGFPSEYSLHAKLPVMLQVLALAPEHRVWREQLARAEARLRQSGVLAQRGLERNEVAQLDARRQENRQRSYQERREIAASGKLKSCALAGCGAVEAHVSHFGKCGACKAVSYCCREHQQSDWPAHKAACKATRKAAAAEDAA
jgi:hypothetical protein